MIAVKAISNYDYCKNGRENHPSQTHGALMKKLLRKNENNNKTSFDATELEHIFALFENVRDISVFDYDHPVVKAVYFLHVEHNFPLDSLPDNLFDLVINLVSSEAEESNALNAVGEYENDY